MMSSQQISDTCAPLFPITYYQVYFLRESMETDDFQKLVEVGLRKLLLLWEENSSDHREFYLCLAAESTDPFTVNLDLD